MALRFVDSFDHYATADITDKWTSINNSITIGATGRNSTNGLRVAASINGPTLGLDAQATWIIGAAYKFSTFPTATRCFMDLLDGTTVQVSLGITTAGNLVVFRGNASGTLLGTGSSTLSTGVWYYIELKVTISDAAGVVAIQLNGAAETITFVTGTSTTQDTKASTNASANIIALWDSATSGAITLDRDDLYICDGTDGTAAQGTANNDFLGDVRVEALFPSGAGNYAQFTSSSGGANYTNVDEASANGDTDYNSDLTSGHIDSFAMTNLTPTSGTVIAVQTNVTARKDDGGTRSLKPFFRISSTDYARTTVNLTDSYYDQHVVEGKSPASGTAWTISEVNGLEFGYKVP